MDQRIALCEPNIGDAERVLVREALESPMIAYGPTVDKFEARVAQLHGRKHGVAVSSGTVALHLALLAAGVRAPDEVLLPTLTFVAPANAVRYVGAHPILFDAEPDYRQIDVERLSSWVARECRPAPSGAGSVRRGSRRRIGALLGVDLLGHPCDIDALRSVADRLEVPLVLDAAQSLGATVRDRPLGDSADLVCLSFNANKVITTAGGGMILCDDDQRMATIRSLANQAKVSGDAYVHHEVGFNYRMACAQAALGIGQLGRLDELLRKKAEIAAHYVSQLREVPGVTLPQEASWAKSTHWLYTVHIDAARYGHTVVELARKLDNRGIDSRPIFTPLHQTGVHAGCEAHLCPVAERLGETGLTLPSSTKYEQHELYRVTAAVRDLCA